MAIYFPILESHTATEPEPIYESRASMKHALVAQSENVQLPCSRCVSGSNPAGVTDKYISKPSVDFRLSSNDTGHTFGIKDVARRPLFRFRSSL